MGTNDGQLRASYFHGTYGVVALQHNYGRASWSWIRKCLGNCMELLGENDLSMAAVRGS